MPVRRAIAILVLAAVLLAGCGGGSASTGVAKRSAVESEEGFFAVGGPGPPPADGRAPLRGARLRAAEKRHVEEGEMVVGDEGWVHSGAGVFWTPDGGRTWRPITPPVPAVSSVYFADARHGWALHETGHEEDARPVIYRTDDGGRTWQHTRLRGYDKLVMPAARASFSLVDGHELFVLVKASGDTASNFGSLFVSQDAGRHWRALPTPPQAGQIDFETPRRGWLIGGFPGPALHRTVDGGRTWTTIEPGKPFDPSPPEKGGEYIGPSLRVDYTEPLIGPDGHGILGTVEAVSSGGLREGPTRRTIWRTGDFGHTWHRSERVGLGTTGLLEAGQIFTRRGHSRSFFVRGPRSRDFAVVGPDGHAGAPRPIHGLPDSSSGFTFSDARHGFAFPDFSNSFTLSYTADGGRTWTQVPEPPAPHRPSRGQTGESGRRPADP